MKVVLLVHGCQSHKRKSQPFLPEEGKTHFNNQTGNKTVYCIVCSSSFLIVIMSD